MAAKKPVQFNYVLDSRAGVEYWITGYNSVEIGERPEKVEPHPYGTMLMDFLDMDIGLVSHIGQTLGRFAQVDSPETYVRRWPDFRDDIWKMETVIERLPVIFSDLLTILSFYLGEYMSDPAGRPGLSKAEIDRMARGAQIIGEHCDKIIERHGLLCALIAQGRFSGSGPKKGVRHALELLGENAAATLTDCNIQGHYILFEREGREQIGLCFDAGVDLSAFLTVSLTDILNGHMELAQCQHCGRPFITGGRAIYCERPAPGGSCRTVGASGKYRKSLEQNPAIARYRRAYKRHYARMMKGAVSRPEFAAWQEAAKGKLSAFLAGQIAEAELDKTLDQLT